MNGTVVQPHFPASIETVIKDKNQQQHHHQQQRSLPKYEIDSEFIYFFCLCILHFQYSVNNILLMFIMFFCCDYSLVSLLLFFLGNVLCSNRRGKIAKVETLPAVNVAWKRYKLSPDANVSILTGSKTGSSGVTANLMRTKKQVCFDFFLFFYLFSFLFFLISHLIIHPFNVLIRFWFPGINFLELQSVFLALLIKCKNFAK